MSKPENERYMHEWEKVIFRNYSYVETAKIASAISATEEETEAFARATGIDKFKYNPAWKEKGFVTIIRNNWDLLPNDKIAELIGLSEAEFDALLADYDFLGVKLGEKPKFKPPVYGKPKSDEKRLAKIKELVDETYIKPEVEPFDFFAVAPCGSEKQDKDEYGGESACDDESEYAVTDRFTSNYCARYTDVLLDGELADYSDEYLARLKKTGVNGLWLHETLKNLAAFPFDERYSPDYKIRIKNLKKLTERAAKYGVGIYLYLNEPRSMPAEFFDKYLDIEGQKAFGNEYCLCTSSERVQKYVYEAVNSVVKGVPLLKGIFTITMSENPTHCYSKEWGGVTGHTDCPRCGKRKSYEVVAELNNIMCRAVKDANPETAYIANIWGWAEYMGWSMEDTLSCIELLDVRADVMSVSEFDKEFTRGGVTSRVIDYSISVVGPGEYTVKCLKKAKETRHRIWAKVQVNNSWECSAVPYLPVFELMTEHIENVKKLGVSGLMLGWSLGGFTGGALPACSRACKKEGFDSARFYAENYGAAAKAAESASKLFCKAYREYPFSVNSLYEGAQTLGAANLWSLKPDGRKSTMVCYSFDDYEVWSAPYGLDIYINQYKKLCEGWKKGLEILEKTEGNALFEEYARMAKASYFHFYSALLHAEFVKLKNDVKSNGKRIKEIVDEEYKNTVSLYELTTKDAKIGFEMTNHYYYTPANLLEKLLNLKSLTQILTK